MVAYERSGLPARTAAGDGWQIEGAPEWNAGWSPSPGLSAAQQPFSLVDLLGVVWRRKLLIGLCVAGSAGLGAAYLSRQVPVYRATVEMLIDPQALQVVGRDIIASDGSSSLNFANVDSQPLVIGSVGVLGAVVDILHLDADPLFAGAGLTDRQDVRRTRAIDSLRERLVVHRVDPSLVFQLTVSHPDAVQAARIANTIAEVYFRQASTTRLDATRRANESLVNQVRDLRQKLEAAEAAVEQFRARNGLISTGQSGLLVDQQLKDLTAQIGTASAQVGELTARSDQIRGLDAGAVVSGALPEAVASPTIAGLRGQYASADGQLARLTSTLGPRNPQIAELRAQREAVRQLLEAEIARVGRAAAAETERATATLKTLQDRAAALTRSQLASGEAQISLRQLESEVDATRSVYNAALARTKELDQQQQISTSNSRVISEALPPLKASGPTKALVLAAAALFGLALGVAAAYLRELVPGRLRAAEDVARALNTALLGTLPGPPRRRIFRRRRGGPPSDASTLAVAAQVLRGHLGRSLPAAVLLLPASPTDMPRAATALAEALGERGRPARLCTVEDRLREVSGEVSATLTALPRRGLAAAGEQQTLPGLAAADADAAVSALTVVWADTADPLMAARSGVDAVVLVASLGRTSGPEIRRLPGRLGLVWRRVAGLVVLDAAS